MQGTTTPVLNTASEGSEALMHNLAVVSPELILAIGSMMVLLMGVVKGVRSTNFINTIALLLLVLAGIGTLRLPVETGPLMAFSNGFVVAQFAVFMKILVLGGAGAAIIMSRRFMKAEKLDRAEYPVLILFATLGMMMMISAQDLISLYVGLELQSLSLYVLASINRDSQRSTEAGLKYFVLGALSSGMLLYGASLIYGFSGTVNFLELARILEGGAANLGLIVGLVFLASGLAFKVSAVPFHMWTPDVYEGAPTPVTAFFAGAPKVAAMALFLRAFLVPFDAVFSSWQQIIFFISVASMILAAFAAIGQSNLKRLMAYSSIGHMGYALVGLAAGGEEGVRGVLIYMAIYLVTTIGVFVCILSMRRSDGMVEQVEDLSGLSRTHPYMAYILAMLMFSLMGVPPFAGFFGKFYVFMAAVEQELYALAVIGVVTSVIAGYYYLRIVKVMFFDEAKEAFERPLPVEMGALLTVSGAGVLLFFLYPAPLVAAATQAARSLLIVLGG
jgi:NADH-quinone oxidoreductase subunit N